MGKTKNSETYKIPKIGQYIYYLWHKSIVRTKVGYLGKESFIIDFDIGTDFAAYEWWYQNYNADWTTSLSKAKELYKESMRLNRVKFTKHEYKEKDIIEYEDEG